MRGERSHKQFVFALVFGSALLVAPLCSEAGLITQESDRPTQATGSKNSLTILEESLLALPGSLAQDSSMAQAVATITHNATTHPADKTSLVGSYQGIVIASLCIGGLFLLAMLNVWRRRRFFAPRPYPGWWSWPRRISRYWRMRGERDFLSGGRSSRSWRPPASRSRRPSASRSRRSQSSKW